VFEACRIGAGGRTSEDSSPRDLSVGADIVWQQFDHMFY